MSSLKGFWPFILIGVIVLLFFFPIFKGNIPFPGDLLVNENPYKAESFLGYNPGSYPNKAQGRDIITEIYPWRYFSIDQIKKGNIPFWNPHNFSGNPQLANFQTALFYPINLLYFLLPFNAAWTLIIMLQPFLAGIFMYLFLKKGAGLKDFACFIGGVSFAFSSYMSVWIEYGNIGSTFLWLPLALLFTKYFFKKLNSLNFLMLSLVLSLSILAGYIQGLFYIYALCFFYYTYLLLSSKNAFLDQRKNLLFLSSFLIPVLITSFQIFPTLQLFSESTRGAYGLPQIEKNLAPVFYWITIFAPDFFGNPATRNYWIDGTYIERVMYPGTVILAFVIFALFNKIKVQEKRFFAISALVSLVLATSLPLVKYFYLIPIPVISTTVPTRELSVFIFSLIVLGAIGIDYFLRVKDFKKTPFYILFAIYLIILIGVIIFMKLIPDLSDNLKVSLRNLVIPSVISFLVIVSVFLKKINIKITYVLIVFLVIFDLFYFFHKITPFSPESFIYPKSPIIDFIKEKGGIDRFWGYGSAYIMPNFDLVNKTYSPEGNDPLHISRYTELLSSSINGKLPEVLPRPDANIAPGYGERDLKDNFFRKRVLDLLGIKYILHKVDLKSSWENPDTATFPEEKFELIEKIYPWQIYENKDVLPRFFLTSDFVLANNKKEALSFIYDKKIDLKKTLILEERPNIVLDYKAKGNVNLISYNPNKIVFKVNTSGNILLFLSDNYYSEWDVKIDGKPSKIMPANYSFRAVEVSKGAHNVEFYYNPKSFKYGLILSLTGILLIIIIAAYVNIKPKVRSKNDLN